MGLPMSLDLFAGFLEIAGQSTGRRGEQPEHEKSDAVDSRATEFRLVSGYGHQINGIECGKKQAGSNTGGEKGWPEYCDDTLNNRYVRALVADCRIGRGFHGLRPRALPRLTLVDRWRVPWAPVEFKTSRIV